MATNTLHDWDHNLLSGSLTDIGEISGNGYQPGTYIKADELNTILRETSVVTKAFIDYLCLKSTGSENITVQSSSDTIKDMINAVIATSGGSSITPATYATLGGIKAASIQTTTKAGQVKIGSDNFLYMPVATANSFGVVKAKSKVSETTEVAIDSNGKLWYTPGSGGGSYILPVASDDGLGGVKAKTTTSTTGKTRAEITSSGELYYTDTKPNDGTLTIAWQGGSDTFTANASSAKTITIARVAKVGASQVGSSGVPVYIASDGTPTACSGTSPQFSYNSISRTLTITTS